MCNNRNITCSHPFPEKQSPGVSQSLCQEAELALNHTLGLPRVTTSGFTVAEGPTFCPEWGGNEEVARCLMLYFFLYNIFFCQEIIRCPEMSPSFSRKNSLCACRHPTIWDTLVGKRNAKAAAVCSLPASTLYLPFSPLLTYFSPHLSPYLLSKGCP